VLQVVGARGHNLRDLTVRFPLGQLVAVTGVSGSGKSSLVDDTLARALARRRDALPHDALHGRERVGRVVRVDQSPLGRSARSSPATATKVWDTVRQLLARTPEAKARGFGPERFSLATPGGRCEACEGEGVRRVEMLLLPDVSVACEVCAGRRFDEGTLGVTWRGHSASELLDMPVARAREVFAGIPAIAGTLATMDALGLGYLPLGQGADTLSGGEAQRVKLARELGRPGEVAGTLYLLDEPTVGLHPQDVDLLVRALRGLVSRGGSVIAVEHDPLFVGACAYVVELGPGAGPEGGRIVREGRT
jgi:excinuclease ABC subunit A